MNLADQDPSITSPCNFHPSLPSPHKFQLSVHFLIALISTKTKVTAKTLYSPHHIPSEIALAISSSLYIERQLNPIRTS